MFQLRPTLKFVTTALLNMSPSQQEDVHVEHTSATL